MKELTDLFSGAGLFLFGIAAVLAGIFLLRILRRVDRIIALAEIGAVDQLPSIVRKVLGK
jgi:hypothetical protein